jgi:DNA-binding LacI/PurR family transcriptional regulator
MKYKTSMDRCQGYISALIENGINVNRKLIIFGERNDTKPNGYYEMKKLLESDQKIDAVFCFNDNIAQGSSQAIREMGLEVSSDIGIIGYDNTDMCEIAEPRITSVAYRNVEIGEKAAELLWKMTNHQPMSNFEYYLFQPDIVIRESCMGPGSKHGTGCEKQG